MIGILVYSIFGGQKDRDILGGWVANTDSGASGFQCGRQGIAASINNSRVQYYEWELHGNNLLLKGKLFTEEEVEDIIDTLTIKKLTSSSLTVSHNGKKVNYTKQ